MILELVHFRYDRFAVLLRSPQLTLSCIISRRSYSLGTYYLALKTNRQSLRILKSIKVYDYLVTVDEEVRGVLRAPFLCSNKLHLDTTRLAVPFFSSKMSLSRKSLPSFLCRYSWDL